MDYHEVENHSDENMVIYAAPLKIGSKYWFSYAGLIFNYDEVSKELRKEYHFNLYNGQENVYSYLTNIGPKIIFSPFCMGRIAIYDIETQQTEFLFDEGSNEFLYYRNIVAVKEKTFLLPGRSDCDILVLDKLRNVRHISIADWHFKGENCERTSEYVKQDRYLWITAHYSNQVLKLNVDTEQYELIEIGKDCIGFTGITIDGEYLWLAESSTGAFLRYNTFSGEVRYFNAPSELNFNSSTKNYVHLSLFNFEKYIVSVPALCGNMAVLNKKTEEFDIAKIDFFNAITNCRRSYEYGNYTTCSFGKKINENTLWVQRASDGEIAIVNVEDFTYTTFSFKLKEKEIKDICTNLYNNKGSMLCENRIVSLNSMFCFLKNHNENDINRDSCYIGADIWTKIKSACSCLAEAK